MKATRESLTFCRLTAHDVSQQLSPTNLLTLHILAFRNSGGKIERGQGRAYTSSPFRIQVSRMGLTPKVDGRSARNRTGSAEVDVDLKLDDA